MRGERLLDRFFKPDSIAVVGASRRPGSFGYEIMRNLMRRYRGRIYPVNPNYADVMGVKSYPSISSIGEPVDLAVIAVRAGLVPQVLDEAGQVGVRAAIIVSGGFSESGREGEVLEEEVRRIASMHGIRVIGPNCIGVYDALTGVDTFFLPWERMRRPPKGPIVLVGQSGALLTMIMDIASTMGVGVYRAVNIGNKVDVDEADVINYVAGDEYTRVIGVYTEGFRESQGRKLADSINRAIARGVSVVVLKGGRTRHGARAAYSHTASLAGSYDVFKSAMRQAGAVVTEDPLDFIEALKVLFKSRGINGPRVGVVTNAGGPGVVAVDSLESYGLEVPELSDAVKERLREMFPRMVSVSNPVDLTGGASDEDYRRALRVLAGSGEVDAFLVIAPVQPATMTMGVADAIAEAASRARDKAFIAVTVGAGLGEDLAWYLESLGIPTYTLPSRAAYGLHILWERYRGRCSYRELDPRALAGRVEGGLFKVPSPEAFKLVERYGIGVPGYCLARDRGGVEECFSRLEPPLAAKIESPDVVHKTDVGGVELGLETLGEALEAYDRIVGSVSRIHPRARIEGVLYQEIVEDGVEFIVGGRRDPAFGPIILFGLGGVGVELLKDYSIRLPPIDDCHAAEMIGETKASKIIEGYRGGKPLDKASIINSIKGIAKMITENPDIIEAEVNPLIATQEKALAIDVRIIKARKPNN